MKLNPNSLIVKMIQNSFWFIEKDIVPKPTTSCGLFLAGVVSGLWHVAYTFFVSCFVAGMFLGLIVITGVGEIHDLSVLPVPMHIIITMGFVVFFGSIFIYLPAYIVCKLAEWLDKKGAFSKVTSMLNRIFNMTIENRLTRKLSVLCKPIDYKDN